MRRTIAAITVLLACAASACIIGPKQDDPVADRLTDAGTIFSDTSAVFDAAVPSTDTSISAVEDTGPFDSTDAISTDTTDASATDAGDASDDATDAVDAADPGDAGDAAEGG